MPIQNPKSKIQNSHSALLRQWLILKTLAAEGRQATIKTLVEQAGKSEKTIRRDLALLRKVGFPIVETSGDFGRKTFALENGELPRLDLCYDEALALSFCRRAVLPLAGTMFWQSADNVRFQRPADFDIERHLAGSLGVYHGRETVRVRVRFAPAAARYLGEKRMHASQRITRQRDGGAIVEWTLTSTVDARSFVLSFGSAAEVLEPAALRAEIAAEVAALAELYSPASGKQRRVSKAT